MPNKETKPKVIIATPCADSASMKALTAHAIGCTIIASKDLVTDFILRISCDIVSNRTWLVKEAIKNGGTHILFVDCDMYFPPNALEKMLAHEKEIVSARYNKREFPLKSVSEPLTEVSLSDTKLYKAKHSGMGLMLIDLKIFQDPKFGMSEDGKRTPWFNFGRDSQGALAMGEDVWFSNVARDAGYHTFIDPTIAVKHLGEYSY